jgi:hypothetical protein
MGELRRRDPPILCEGINSISYSNPVFGKSCRQTVYPIVEGGAPGLGLSV